MGGKPHPRLNMHARPIANKYREGKLKRTLQAVGLGHSAYDSDLSVLS